MALRLRTRAVPLARISSAVLILAFAIHTIVPDSGPVGSFFDNRVYYGIEFFAVALAAARVVLVAHNRWGWLCVTLAMAFWAAGDFVYSFWIGTQASPPYPSVADGLYLAFYPLAYVGFVLLFRARVTKLTAGIWIDGVTAALAVAALGAAVVFEVVLRSTSGGFSAIATNLAYPLGDTLLLALVVGAFSLTDWRPGIAWLALGAGLAMDALGDSIFLGQVATNSYVAGTLLDVTWPAALLLLGNAAWVPERRTRVVDTEGRNLLLLPAACTVVAIGVLVVDHFERLNVLALVLATAALGGVVVRLGLTFRENRRLLELTRSEAVTDPLTGLGNRRHLLAVLDHAFAVARESEPWLLVVFDLDGFKGYNDSFGHPAGDALLHRLGRRLTTVPRAEGSAFRLGGDEFCLLTPVPTAGIEPLLDEAVAALSETGNGFEIGTSFGAVFIPDDAQDPREALGEADARLYAHKHQKRSRRERPHDVLLQALYEREPELLGHTHGVAALAVEVGRRLELPQSELEELERAAQLHDIGKIAVPDQILRKPGALTEDEWVFIRQHTLVGQRILAASPSLRRIGDIVRATHERWDGAGYPDGISAEDIPLAARIIAVCDAFDAMTTERPYRPALSASAAVAEIERCARSQFDPTVVAIVAESVRHRIAA